MEVAEKILACWLASSVDDTIRNMCSGPFQSLGNEVESKSHVIVFQQIIRQGKTEETENSPTSIVFEE